MEASGSVRLIIEAKLSPGPPMLSLRRHGTNSRWHELAVSVASGNFLAAKVNSNISVSFFSHFLLFAYEMGADTEYVSNKTILPSHNQLPC